MEVDYAQRNKVSAQQVREYREFLVEIGEDPSQYTDAQIRRILAAESEEV